MTVRESEYTEKLKNKLFWLRFITFILLATPLFYFFVSCLSSGAESWKKVTLVMTALISLMLIGLNFILKFHLRSPLFFMLIGIHVIMDNVMVLLVLLAITSLLDEVFLTPWIKKVKAQLIANKEMDKRGL